MLCFYDVEIDFAENIDEFALSCHLITIIFNLVKPKKTQFYIY